MGILVNGNGNPHVYAHQDSDLIAGIVGNQTSIMPVGDKFEANQEDANTIALSSGVIITKEGRRIQLDAGTIDEFIIPTGAQDVQSFYIIGYHLYEDGNSDQLCETFVRKMDSASDTIPESTFRSGATEVYVSLYRVTQDSLNITDIDLLLPYADSIAEVKRNGGNKNLAAIEDGSTASQPYVKGEFVIVGGQFCEVTESISTNDAFIAYPLPNYNIKAGTVGEQITALNQNLTLSYDNTSYSGQQDINSTLQAILDKVYPKEFVISVQPSTFFTQIEGTATTYMPLTMTAPTTGNYNNKVRTITMDLTGYTHFQALVTLNGGANTSIKCFDSQGNQVFSGTAQTLYEVDISALTGMYYFEMLVNSYAGYKGVWDIRVN